MDDVEVVFFDLGKVLIHFDIQNFWKTLNLQGEKFPLPSKEEVFTLDHSYELGEIQTNEFLDGLSAMTGGRYSHDMLAGAFNSIFLDPVAGMEDLVTRAAKNYRIGLVSNTCKLHYEFCKTRVTVLDLFPKQYLSYEMKTMKPDHRYYDAVLADQQCAAGSIVFIDDLKKT